MNNLNNFGYYILFYFFETLNEKLIKLILYFIFN